MDAELRRSPNARKLFREIVPVDPPEIGCENRDATATYTYIIGELVAFVGLWRRRGARGVAWLGDSRHLNANGVGELVIESADLSYYFNHYGVSKAAVERTRHLIARGDEPIVAQLRLPAVRADVFKKVEEVYRRLGLSSALPDMPMESAVIVWKAWEEVGWDNLTPWQQIVVAIHAHEASIVLDRHNVPMPNLDDYKPGRRVAHSVYHPMTRRIGVCAMGRWA